MCVAIAISDEEVEVAIAIDVSEFGIGTAWGCVCIGNIEGVLCCRSKRCSGSVTNVFEIGEIAIAKAKKCILIAIFVDVNKNRA